MSPYRTLTVSVNPAGAQVKQRESLRNTMRVMHSLRLQSEMGPETSPNDLGKLLCPHCLAEI